MARPPRLCSCGAIVPADQLCACQLQRQRERKARHDRKRPNSRQRGYSGEWRKLRDEFIRLHSFCAFCGAPAEHVDHKERHRGNRALLLSWSNLQSLCAHCHNSVKQRQERAAGKARHYAPQRTTADKVLNSMSGERTSRIRSCQKAGRYLANQAANLASSTS